MASTAHINEAQDALEVSEVITQQGGELTTRESDLELERRPHKGFLPISEFSQSHHTVVNIMANTIEMGIMAQFKVAFLLNQEVISYNWAGQKQDP